MLDCLALGEALRKLSVAAVLLLLGLGVALTVVDRRMSGAFSVGEPFPDLVLPSLEDGRPVSIAHFQGTKVVLHVFASW